MHSKNVNLEVVRDAVSGKDNLATQETVRDVPLSFSQEKRDYSWRSVVRGTVAVENLHSPKVPSHDPWAALGGER
jgi:CRISPR system Cascade subunit CasD